MFPSLRAKLVASYGLIIFLCLFLAGSAFVYFLRDYQRQIKLNQLSDLAQPLSWQVRLLERAGASRDQIASFLQDRAMEMGVRVLLVDPSGLVVEDTHSGLAGDRIQLPAPQQPPERLNVYSSIYSRADRQGFVLIVASGRAPSPSTDRFAVRVPSYYVVLAVPEQSLAASWLELAPSLSFAALVSLIVSILVAVVLSRSISKPVAEITRASEEMARGNYQQYIRVRSRDEVGRLAEAFNHMAGQVSASHRTLRDLLANVSHELRTPLTSVQGFSQAMVDGTIKTRAEYAEAAHIINDEASRMQRLVEDMLLLSKIESGQLPMDRSPLDLRELLRACLKRQSPLAQQAGVSLSLEAEQAAQVVGDEHRLEQVFRNLLDNAVRHTPAGGAITVRLRAIEPPRGKSDGRNGANRVGAGRFEVSVHNTGSYIPPEDQARIFERFYQVEKSRLRNGDGSGLGLAIAQEIVHAHGGTIGVASDRASGTTFTVVFSHQPSAFSHQPPVVSPPKSGRS